ncbi:CdaR family transcriptional regulator [Streptomyces sp. F63]|uniref:PucR family transcriptional regulator n=1 Tax=Streptomyces sp. F63 TaxID=2824887 RepID=UPI001FFD5521|nr:PucR family transcriptional regulator [Streptomyces sp. F63]
MLRCGSAFHYASSPDNPHVLRSVTTADGPEDGTTETFTYDEAGNTESRTDGPRNQQLTWSPEGRLATLTENGKTTEYLYDETHPVTRRVEAALLARFGDRRILLTTKDGRIVLVAPGNHEEALTALELADRMDLPGPLLRAADLLVYPVLSRDRQAMADLVRTTLGPLEKARGGAGPMLRTLSAYFDAGCVAAETARRLSLSVRALTYRLARIHELTGSDPSDPMHRYTLQTAVIGARLLDWPAQKL